jgi:hypothetical protein
VRTKAAKTRQGMAESDDVAPRQSLGGTDHSVGAVLLSVYIPRMKTQYFTATSLDGFIATEDDSLERLFTLRSAVTKSTSNRRNEG